MNENKQELGGKALYEIRRKQRKDAAKKETRAVALSNAPKKIGAYILYGAVSAMIIGGFGWYVLTRPNLPPTTMAGHAEESPKSHISDVPIPENIQKHMLEHADGKGKPGVVIQYNCQDYSCEPDMIQKLSDLVKKYPDNVYLAPGNYDAKVVLTKLGELKTLDGFNESAIKEFME